MFRLIQVLLRCSRMKTRTIHYKEAVIWVFLGAAVCFGEEFNPETSIQNQSQTLNQSQPSVEDIEAPTRFKIGLPEQTRTFSDYLHGISGKVDANGSVLKQSSDDTYSKVVVVTRVGKDSKTKEEEWTIVAEPRSDDFNDLLENESQDKEVTLSLDYLLDAEDIQKYIDDYENIFFSFKDLLTMGTNPRIKQKIDEKRMLDQESGKKFNVSYVMPIPNKKGKYFEIIIPNLTEYQYNEINTLLQEHIQTSTNQTREDMNNVNISYSNIRGDKKHVTRSLTDSSPLFVEVEEPKSQISFPSNLTDTMAFFRKELADKGYSQLLHSLNSDLPKHFMNKTENKEPEVMHVVGNSGLSIPVATDYNQNIYRDNSEGDATDKSHVDSQTLNTNPQGPMLPNQLYTQRSTSSPRNQRPENTRSRMRTNSVTPQTNTKPIFSQQQATRNGMNETTQNTNKLHTILSDSNNTRPEIDKDMSLEEKPSETNVTDLGINMNSKIPEELSQIAQDLGGVNILQAANFILDMKEKLEEEERKKNERYKSYIKSYLQGGNSFLPGKSENGSIMKINKQDDILEELKFLMLDYFTFMNFNLFDPIGTNSSLAIESILNATNLFELMERSSKLVKLNLQYKIQNESKEPTGFVKKIVDIQVEKCRELTNNLTHNKQKDVQSNKPNTKQTHKTYLLFTRCMNLKLSKCVRGFSIWLQRGRFFRRPQFNLNRAYQNYEMEKNLYCLRTHNALTSESNTRGIKVKPRMKVNRNTGMRRKIKGGTKSSRPLRKMRKGNMTERRGVRVRKLKNPIPISEKPTNNTQTLELKGNTLDLEYQTNQTSFE